VTTSRSEPVALGAVAVERNGSPLLFSTKLLVPRPPLQVVDRHRLIDKVSAAAGTAPLTLISAPAGAGKTILAAAWAAHPDQTLPVAWLTLDDRDDQAGVFWSHVLDALAHTGVVSTSTQRPTHPEEVDPSFIERLAVGLLARDEPVVLVLDEAERLKGRKVAEQLDLLLRSAGPRVRLVVVTRADPLLPLHRYRLEGTVAEIRYDDLAFTAAEVRTLLEFHGVAAPELTNTLVDRTEGWAAGVRLAALAMKHKPAGASTAAQIEACLGPKGSVLAEYLIAEVLREMPAGDRDFLLRTSVAREIFPGLANELTGRSDGEQVLMDLSHGNAFVQLVPGSPGCYRTHSLFREFLRAMLAQEAPAEVAALHRRAARWFAASGRVTEAVDHAVAGGDWVGAAGLVVDGMAIGQLLLPATTTETGIARRLSQLPDDVDSPEVSAVRAALAVRRGDLQRAEQYLARSEEHLTSAGRNLVLAIAITRTRLCSANGDIDATLTAARRALGVLHALPVEDLVEHHDLQALALSSEGMAHLRAGDLNAACTSLGQALVTGAANGCEAERLRCLAMLALAEACRGHLSRAQELAETAQGFAMESAVVAANRPAAAHLAHAWVALERQDLTGAQRWLGRAVRFAETRSDTLLASVSALLQVRLRRDRGDIDGARRLLSDNVVRTPWLRAPINAEAAALGLARRRQELTQRVIYGSTSAGNPPNGRPTGGPVGVGRSQVPTVFEDREHSGETLSAKVELLLLQAQRHLVHGYLGSGRSAVLRAMALAKGEGIRRPFAHVPPQVRWLIRTDNAVSARAGWLRPERVPASPRQHSPADIPQVDQALSERELEVLRHLSALLTTEEIAAAMLISVNTVKTHIRGILRKLSVSRRNEAVRRARQLRLV